MDNSIYENSDSDKDVDLSLNCSVDQSFRLNNTLLEKKDSNNENGEKITKQPSDNPIKMENFSASPIPILNQKIDSLHNSHNSNFSLSMNKNASAGEKPFNKPVGGAYGAIIRPASQIKPPAFGYNINTNNSTNKENIANSSVLSNFSNNAKTLQKIQNLGPSLENKSIQNKKEISANYSIDNCEAESNLDLSLGESFSSNFNQKEINIPNSSITSNIMTMTPKIPRSQPKTESDLDKILNTNKNNLNALNNNNDNNNNNCDNINNNNNPNSTNKNINLNSIQQNMANNNNFSLSSPSDFGNFSNKNLLETIKEHQMENETDDALAESLDRKVNKYNLSLNENDIRSKSITNPSFFMDRNEKLFDSSVEKTNPNRIEILVKNNKQEIGLDPVYNRLSMMATPSMKIDEILAKNNYNNLNINTTTYGNIGAAGKTIAPNDIPSSGYAGKEIKTGDNSFYKTSAYSKDIILEPPKKPTLHNSIPNPIPNSDANIGSSPAATGSSIDDILKKYGIKIDENTAEVLPLNNNSNNLSVSKKEEEPKNEIKTINNNQPIDVNNSNKNLNSDLDSIRKSIVKLKETDLASLQKELIEKEEILTNKKNENFLDELKKEEGLNSLNLDNNNNNKIESPSKENKLNNFQKSDSFSSKVQKILESGDKKPEIANNYFNACVDFSAADNQRRNTSFQLQPDSNKSVMFNINNQQVNNDNDNLKSNINDIENAGTRKSAYQPPSNINLNDNLGNEKNQIEDSEDMESRNKEKVKRNSGIFMKRAKIQTQEKEEPKPNSDVIITEVNRKSTYQEKLISKYINELNEEDEEIRRIGRNTNITSQNKYNLSTISFNADTSKEINSNSDKLAINNNLDNNNKDKKDFEEFENNKTRNSTDISKNKKNIYLNLNDVNEMENEVVSPDTAKGKRVSGFMKRPNTRDLKIEDNSNEGNDIDIDAETNQAKDNFMKKLNGNILKRGNYNEDSESNDDQRSKNKLYKKNSEERSEEADSNPSEMEELEEEEVEFEEHEENEENEYEEIKELDEEYESEEISDEAESNENKKAETDALDDIYLNHILKFTEKEIKKNKELTEENSRKNSAITIFNLINTKLLLLKNRIFYKIKNFTRYKAKNYNIALINCFRIKRNILKETIRKYFNMFLFTTKKMKIQEEIGIVDKFKSVVMEMDAKEYNLNKFLELDNEKLALLFKSIMTGNLSMLNSCNNESDSKQAKEMKDKNIPNIPAIPSVKGVPTNLPKPPSNLLNAIPCVPSTSVPKPPTNAPPIPTSVPKPPGNLPNNIPSVPLNVPKPPTNFANNVPQVPTNIPKPPSTVPQVPVNVPKPPSNLTNNIPQVPTNIPKPPSTVPQAPVNVPKPPSNLVINVPQVPTNIPKPPSNVPQVPVNVPKPPSNLANNLPPVPTNIPKPPSNVPQAPPQVPSNFPKPPSNLANNPVNIPKPHGSLPSVPAGNIPMIPGAIKPGAPPVPGSKPSIPGAPRVPNAPGVPQMPGIAKPGAPPVAPGGIPKPSMPGGVGAPQAPGGPVKVTNVPQAPKPPPELQPKRVNWNLIPKIKTKNTLWEKPLPTFNVDYSIITKYFCEPKKKKGGAAADSQAAPESEEKKGKTEVIRLLDDKKSMNLGIALNKFRLTPDDIKSILENTDDEKISLDEIQKIIDLSPTDEEVEKLKEYTGDLSLISLGERYCHLLAMFNRSKLILEAMKFKKKISIDKKDIIYKYNLIKDGLLSVKESKNFENLLRFILYVGNYLNSDMAKGNAFGVNLGILDILEDMKSNVQEKYSLLEVIVLNIRTKEQSLLSFYKDFNDFDQILQLDLNEVEAQIKEIERNLKYIKENRESLEKIGEKMGDPKLKKLTSYLNSIELNSCGAIDEIITAQDSFKKEIKTAVQHFGEDEKNFKPIDFLRTISEFVKNFKKACMRFSTEEAKLLKKKIMEEKKKNPSGQKSEISKEIQKIRKTVVRKTENRKTNIRKTANKPSDEKHKEEKTESNSTNNANQPAENTNRKSNNIRIVSTKDNTNSANSKENERKTKARMTKTRITRFIQKTVNIQKDESDDDSDEDKDDILFKSSLKN